MKLDQVVICVKSEWSECVDNQYPYQQISMGPTVSNSKYTNRVSEFVSKNDFNVLKVIGKGAFGTVYMVTHRVTE